MENEETERKETLNKLEEAGYRLHPKKCKFFNKEAKWIGNKIHQDSIRPLQDKLESVTKLNIPKNEKDLKSFLEPYNTYQNI